VTHERSTEDKSSQQFRYAKSSETFKRYALLRDLGNLTFNSDYADSLSAKLAELLPGVIEAANLSAQQPDPKNATPSLTDEEWVAFEGIYGSHYANAATFGTVKYLKTTLSEKTEGALVQDSTTLKESASAAFDGFKGGADAEVKNTWGDKYTNTINQEDLDSFFVGKDDAPAPIFLDLRPANELLNPILLRWNAGPLAEIAEIRAPFMWYLLRRHYLDYQRRTHMIDASISALPDKNWSPTIIRFHASAQMVGPTGATPFPYGTISWTPYGGALSLNPQPYYRKAVDAKMLGANDMLPGAQDLTCTLVGGSAASSESGVVLTVKLKLSVLAGPDWDFEAVTLKMPMNGPDHEEFVGTGKLKISKFLSTMMPFADHVLVRLRREVVKPKT